MEILISGLLLGLMGSFHCVGMCGPIALSLPLGGNNIFQKITGAILYNIGRTITYAIMGAFFGLIGKGFQLAGFQKWVSILMGSFMIAAILVPSLFRKINTGEGLPFAKSVRKGIQKMFTKRSFGGLFIIGLLNGLLPCGLVYLAIAGAIGTGDVYLSIVFMILFGLGTLPLMLVVSMAGNLLSLAIRNRINKVMTYVVVLIGIIFILRGLSLGIPYLSPPKEKLNPEMHMQDTEKVDAKKAVKGSCCHTEEKTEKKTE